MIRFYKTIRKKCATLKSYLTGAVLKMRHSFSYNFVLCYLAKGFRKFFKTKAAKDKKRGVRTLPRQEPVISEFLQIQHIADSASKSSQPRSPRRKFSSGLVRFRHSS